MGRKALKVIALTVLAGLIYLAVKITSNAYEPIIITTMESRETYSPKIIYIHQELTTEEVIEEIEESIKETVEETPNEKWVEYGTCTTTCYCLCEKCCGKNWQKALTASGTTPVRYRTVANGGLPFGTKVYIEGVGYRIVEDRGSKVGKMHFDIYVGEQNHQYASEWGSKKRRVWVINEN